MVQDECFLLNLHQKQRKMNTDNVVTIRNIIDHSLNEYINYNDQILVSYINISDMKNLDLFRFPCHLKAATILICQDGEFDVSVSLRNYRIEKNSVLINLPENIIHINKVKDLRAVAVLVSSEFAHGLLPEIMSHTHYYSYEVSRDGSFSLPEEEMEHLSHCLAVIRHSITSPLTSSNEEHIRHLIAAFVTNVLMLHHHYHNEHTEDVQGSKGKYLIFDRFMELLRMYHSRERELKFYADKMCITPKYLSDVVRKTSGRRATEWISEFVILEAKSLLIYSGKNVQEISRSLNFPTQSAFGKYFKSQVGVSPSDFVESNRKF